MCDRCGVIFPETAEGWGVGTISTNVPRDDGRGTRMVEQRIDLCPTDNRAPTAHLMPQTAGQITGPIAGPDAADRLSMVTQPTVQADQD